MPSADISWTLWILRIIYFTGELSLLIPIYAGFKARHKLLPAPRHIWWCCIMWAVLTFIAEALRLSGHYNILVWNAVTVLETTFIGRAFYLLLPSVKTRFLLRLLAAVFLVTAIPENIYASISYHTTVYTAAIGSVFLILSVLLYFEQLLHELKIRSLEREPMFVIGTGVLIYFSATTIIFLIDRGPKGIQQQILMTFNAGLCVVFHIVIARGFWLARQHTRAATAQPALLP